MLCQVDIQLLRNIHFIVSLNNIYMYVLTISLGKTKSENSCSRRWYPNRQTE